MVLEHALIDIDPDRWEDFETAYEQARPVLASTPGCRRVTLHRGIENQSRYLLLVEWETLDDHLVGFRESDRFGKWRELIGPYFDGAPAVDHYEITSQS